MIFSLYKRFEGMFLPIESPQVTEIAKTQIKTLVQIVKKHRAERKVNRETLADFELAFTLRRPLFYDRKLLSDYPDFIEFSDSIWNRPSVQSWVTQDRSKAHEGLLVNSTRMDRARESNSQAQFFSGIDNI